MIEAKKKALESLLKFAKDSESKGFNKKDSTVTIVVGTEAEGKKPLENSSEKLPADEQETENCCPHCGQPMPSSEAEI